MARAEMGARLVWRGSQQGQQSSSRDTYSRCLQADQNSVIGAATRGEDSRDREKR